MPSPKKVVLITGVSSGFGKETALLLAKKGHIIYGTVRRDTDINGDIKILKMDLTDPLSIDNAVEQLIRSENRIDVLINNAGMHSGGPIETIPEEFIRLQMKTNFMGTVLLIRKVLPVMRNQGGGLIINFSSIGGLIGLPFQGIYSASKFAIEGLSEALRMEVRPFNIKVVVINPGDFHTNNTISRKKYLAPTNENDPYYQRYSNALSKIEHDETNGWTPDIMAKKIEKIINLKNPSQRYIIGSFEQKLSVFIKKILPGSYFRKIIENYYKIS
ncbi:MAG TPA: SDR family oxidoreductase [Bacteroidales bacterium]|nr:SDR family oxidoreductase [Bacteroidales bacterium]HOU95445.1 SDR family oxidoreductase [Bacteroidales bacterium]HQG36119.1 SDR family oxidoreductase [Bacteroidales bacterium]HQG52086.1 SDR family oxidoreductase [Bacteroidales bacterium]HQJ20238.1 SDR family oxidoreductase [Bacteroidales bacterium]